MFGTPFVVAVSAGENAPTASAAAYPTPMPTTPPNTPIPTVSASTCRTTRLFDQPIARSVPISRTRFATDDIFYDIRLEPYLIATGRARPQLAARLGELVETTRHTKRTLVHGDFAPKNILVRQTAGTLELFPIDWETAGWGSPAADMGEGVDLAIYRAEALRYGASWSAETIRGWAAVGKILRHIAAFEWASASLIGGWPPRGVRRMSVRLEDAQTASALEF